MEFYKIDEIESTKYHQSDEIKKSIESSSFPDAVPEILRTIQSIKHFYNENDDNIVKSLEHLNSFFVEKNKEILNENIDLLPIIEIYKTEGFALLLYQFFSNDILADKINLFISHLALILQIDDFLNYLKGFDLFQYIFPRLVNCQNGNWDEIPFVICRLFECQYPYEDTYRILFEDFNALSDLIISSTNNVFPIYKLTDLIVSTINNEYNLSLEIKENLVKMYPILINNIMRFPFENSDQLLLLYHIVSTIVTTGNSISFSLLSQNEIFEVLLSDPEEDSKELRITRIDFIGTCLKNLPPAAKNQFLLTNCSPSFNFSIIVESIDSDDPELIRSAIHFFQSFLPDNIDYLCHKYTYKKIIEFLHDFFLNGDFTVKMETLDLLNSLVQSNHPILICELIKQNLAKDYTEEEDDDGQFDIFVTMHDLLDSYNSIEIQKKVIEIIESLIIFINKHPSKIGFEEFKDRFESELSQDFLNFAQTTDQDIADDSQWILGQLLYEAPFG